MAILAVAFFALPSCSKSESGNSELEYSVWTTSKDNLGFYETLHFKEGWCTWTMYFKSDSVPVTYKYRTKGNTIELYLDGKVFYTMSHSKGSNTISVVSDGKTLTFTRQ